ncbi:MAG: YdcH family protein [Pseudomonas oryzihabitans]
MRPSPSCWKTTAKLDQQILDLEEVEESSGDEELGRLRRERVLLKDKIAQQLKYPS